MTMKKTNETNEAAAVERSEKAKKLYRYVTEVARRSDEAIAASLTVADLFTVKIEVQRQKLRDNCEKLIFLDPINYSKKSLELLWRKVYYETISAVKKHHKSNSDEDNLLSSLIASGIGHFHNIITKVQTETKVWFNDLDYSSLYADEVSEDLETPTTNALQQVHRNIIYNCLVYLGDLSRYQVEIFPSFYDSSIAARYYFQAAHVDMLSGMPYNQLGNLYLDKNHNIDSVCYYIHCLSCTETFEGALGNLSKLFEKNAQFSNTISEAETLTQSEHLQSALSQFLTLIDLWYMEKNDTDIPQRCNTIAHQLKVSMEFKRLPLPDINKSYDEYQQAVEDENANPSFMNCSLIHKIVLICLFTIAKLDEIDEKKAFACKAFTLALLSQLLQKLLHQLEVLGLQNPAEKYRKSSLTIHESNSEIIEEKVEEPNDFPLVENRANSCDESERKDDASQSDDELSGVVNGEAKSGKKTINKRRRRRRAASSDSSDATDTESESEADAELSISDNENLSDTSIDSENDKSDVSESEEEVKIETVVNGAAEIEVEEVNDHKQLSNGNSKKDLADVKFITDETMNVTQIHQFLSGDNILPSIKLLLDWALNEKELILSCGDSGESLFQCVVDLLNTFTFNFKPNSKHSPETCDILDYAKKLAKNLELEYKTIPLPEDVNLRGTNICKFDKDAAEWLILNRYKPSVYEENVIRILNFIEFGNQIAKLVPRIKVNRTMQILYLKRSSAPKASAKLSHKKTREWHSSKKPHAETGESGLLRRLGRLWLTARVRELERSGRAAPPPTLLALDAAALNKHLRRVKQLLKARAFVLLIPAIVLQELDELKREESSARDAIRWLESQLRGGSRGLRAQRPGQARALPRLKYPRKAPPHVHNFIQILEYCHHFVADEKPSGGSGDGDSAAHAKAAPLLVLLTGAEPGAAAAAGAAGAPGAAEEYKEFSVSGAAQAAGVTVTYIGDFYTKWRQASHKGGKR